MQNLPIVDEQFVRRLHSEATKVWNAEKRTALIVVASSRAESVEQFDAQMVKTFLDLSKWCMYERNFRRASLLMEKAWGSVLTLYPDNRLMQLECLWMLKECYIRLDEGGCIGDSLRAALVIMQDCIDRRDTYAISRSPYGPKKFSANVLTYLKNIKHTDCAELTRKVRDLEVVWSRLVATIDPPCD